MTFKLIQGQKKRGNYLIDYKCKGQRRLLAVSQKQEEVYVDTRNLWKASTSSQQKQYESIRSSDLLNKKRKTTFLKFNYRHAEDKNLCYPDVYKSIVDRTEQYQARQRLKKIKQKNQIKLICKKVTEQIKQNNFCAEKDWLEQYHQKDHSLDNWYKKKSQLGLGTMNVSDLWGQKQLQQSLGFLPCKRDRPRLLKFYSSKFRMRKMKTQENNKSKYQSNFV